MAGDAVASVVASATGRDADLCGAEGPSARASPERERERERARARARERERELCPASPPRSHAIAVVIVVR